MGYHQKLAESCEWLSSNQNSDNGWGLSPEQASSIVNTAEAVYVLKRGGLFPHQTTLGVEYICAQLAMHISERGKRIRYVNFALLALLENTDIVGNADLQKWAEWLMAAKNPDGAWGQVVNDRESRLFPTCLTLISLSRLGYTNAELDSGFNWLISRRRPTGWSFDCDASPPSHAATALGVLALKCKKNLDERILDDPKDLLLSTTQWATEPEDERGTAWQHCTYEWVFPALMALGVEPYHKTIAEGVRQINRYTFEGGWREPAGNKTVRGQFWAVFALEAIHRAFDPSVHTYRIDSERSQAALVEPTFVNILVNTGWATIVPRRLYQGLTYALFISSLMSFSGLYRLLSRLPRQLDLVFCVVLFIPAYVLIRSRKRLFPRWLVWIVIGVVVVLEAIHLIWGESVNDLFRSLSHLWRLLPAE